MKPLAWFAVLAVSSGLLGQAQQPAEPFATMAGGTVTLHPSNATFQVPDEVLTDRRAVGFTRYLTRTELERIKNVDAPYWDQPYNQIWNAVLPFSACVVHVGTEPWGIGSKSFGDLQIRVYVLDSPATPVRQTLGRDALAETIQAFPPATALFPPPTLTTTDAGNAWSLSRIHYIRRGTDFSAGVNLDFYVREFGQQTVVIAMHFPPATRYSSWDATVAKIVESFTWPK